MEFQHQVLFVLSQFLFFGHISLGAQNLYWLVLLVSSQYSQAHLVYLTAVIFSRRSFYSQRFCNLFSVLNVFYGLRYHFEVFAIIQLRELEWGIEGFCKILFRNDFELIFLGIICPGICFVGIHNQSKLGVQSLHLARHPLFFVVGKSVVYYHCDSGNNKYRYQINVYVVSNYKH